MSFIARLITGLLLALAFYARPLWLAFAIAGIILGLGIRYIKANWSKVLPLLKRLLITSLVVGIGLFPLFSVVRRREIVFLIMATCIAAWTSLPAKVRAASRLFASLLLAFRWSFVFVESLPNALIAFPLTFTRYTSRIDLSQDGRNWKIRSEILFDQSDPHTFIQVESERVPADLVNCGWYVIRDGATIQATRQRSQQAKSRRFAVTTLNAISLDADLHCGDLRFEIPPNSQSSVFTPKYTVAKTYPDSTRAEMLGDERERIAVPVNFASDESPVLRFEVINPLLRSAPGEAILGGIFWIPFGFIWTIGCTVFADQIKGKLVIPVLRRVFRLVGLKWFEEQDGNKEKQPLIIIP